MVNDQVQRSSTTTENTKSAASKKANMTTNTARKHDYKLQSQ